MDQQPYDQNPEEVQPVPEVEKTAPEANKIAVQIPAVKPIVTIVLIAINVILYVLQLLSEQIYQVDLLFLIGGKFNELILAGQLWRLITPAFIHGSIPHLFFNMYGLYIIGRGLERSYGHWRFLGLFMLSAFAGNVLSFTLSPHPSLGSSTGVVGLLAAEGVFAYQNRKLLGRQAQRVLLNLLMVLGINLAYGLMPGTNVDNWGHLGGLLGGFIFASLAGPKWAISGIPPYLKVMDVRQKSEVYMAAVFVTIGFIAIAAIPFIKQ